MKTSARLGSGKQPRNQAADDGAADAEQARDDEIEMLHARHDGARDQPNDETNYDRPNNV